MEDLKHWKEWKATEMARIEVKKKKRDARQAAKTAPSSKVTKAESARFTLVSASGESQQKEEDLIEQCDEYRATSATVDDATALSSELDEKGLFTALHASGSPDSSHQPARYRELVIEKPLQSLDAATALHSHAEPTKTDLTPRITRSIDFQAATTEKKAAATHLLRVTPWLGDPSVEKVAHSGVHQGNRKPKAEDESFFSQPMCVTPGATKTSLVRDRVGAAASTTSLRKAALQNTMHVESPQYDIASTDPLSSQTDVKKKKRKIDLESLSSSEKSIRLKELSKMAASEKRELYAPYKGKGRYLAPEDMWVLFRSNLNSLILLQYWQPFACPRRV